MTIPPYRSFWLVGPSEIEQRLLSPMPLEPNYARLKFHYCGICGSDLSHYHGQKQDDPAVSIGHEFVAEIVELSSKFDFSLRIGDLVTSDLNFRCGRCESCKRNESHLCERGQVGKFSNRGFAEFATIHGSYLYKIPGTQPVPKFCLVEPLSCALHAVNWVDLPHADTVLVIGAGSLGLCVCFGLYCRGFGSKVELLDNLPERGNRLAQHLNLEAVQSFQKNSYDIVVDASGSVEGLKVACEAVRPGGQISMISHLNDKIADFFPELICRKDIQFKNSYLNGEPELMDEAIIGISEKWNSDWDDMLGLNRLADLSQLFEKRSASTYNKDIVAVSELIPA